MTTYNEASPGIGDVLAWEINPSYCREQIAVTRDEEDSALAPGQVMAQVTVSGAWVPWDPEVDPADGSETAAGVLLTACPADATSDAVLLVRGPAIVNGPNLTAADDPAAGLQLLGITVAGTMP